MRVDGRIRFEYATCGRGIFESGKKKLRIQKYPDTCGRGLRCDMQILCLCRFLRVLFLLLFNSISLVKYKMNCFKG